jgi:hypothetical protein
MSYLFEPKASNNCFAHACGRIVSFPFVQVLVILGIQLGFWFRHPISFHANDQTHLHSMSDLFKYMVSYSCFAHTYGCTSYPFVQVLVILGIQLGFWFRHPISFRVNDQIHLHSMSDLFKYMVSYSCFAHTCGCISFLFVKVLG